MSEPLVAGFDHIATATRDVDRLVEFYKDIFGIEPLSGFPMMGRDGRKIALFPLGDGPMLQAVEVGPVVAPELLDPPAAVFYGKARFDHASFRAADETAFEELRARLMGAGASDGSVIEAGPLRFFRFTDPDGWLAEVVWTAPSV